MTTRGAPRWERHLLVAGALMFAGCPAIQTQEVNYAHTAIHAGATLVLEREVVIPARETVVYIQDGRTGPGADEGRPYCKLEVKTLKETRQPIAPDRFLIRRVNWGTSQISLASPLVVAQLGDSGLPSHLYFKTELYLVSERQPDVNRLTCEVDRVEASGMSLQSYLTLSDVNATLKGVFRLEQRGAGAAPK